MNKIKLNTELEKYLEPPKPGEPMVDHRTWMDEQIKATLEKRRQGKMAYHKVEDVKRDFDF